MGDPSGIGPEVAIKALNKIPESSRRRIVVIGDRRVLRGYKGAKVRLAEYEPGHLPPAGHAAIIDMNNLPENGVETGQISAAAGKAAAGYIKKAAELCMTGTPRRSGAMAAQAGELAGIITAPINKKAFSLAGIHYSGHTEFLSRLAGVDNVAMMLMSSEMRVVILSTHLSLRKAIDEVKFNTILKKIKLIERYIPSKKPIAVCGLNPHASDGSVFGNEEERIIAPAISAARSSGIKVDGPLSADSLFAPQVRKKYRAILAMYHDQGLVGIKSVSFGKCVNVTLGLPFIRTSVDHGTAMDIAGRGKADPSSMVYAIKTAFDLERARR
jgi:4-hydroxythreonine-4-phosphate dehydrogenase